MGRIRITGTLIDFFKTTATGIISMVLPDAGAPPTEAGELLRHGADVKWHDGTAARTIVSTDATQTLANKTLSATASVGFADQGSDPTSAGTLQRNASDLKFHTGAAAVSLLLSGPRSIQVFTASGTWTRPAGVRTVIVEVVGGGGGGGGAASTDASTSAAAGGGGGGGYALARLDVTTITSATITVGAGGAGGPAGANNGSSGGTSSWSDGVNTVSATGGAGGAAGVAGAIGQLGGNGGVASGGNVLNLEGGGGGYGYAARVEFVVAGRGGASQRSGMQRSPQAPINGLAGLNYGGGGTGAANTTSQPARPGGAGAPGVVIVWEYT
jgi:hypothetical protein